MLNRLKFWALPALLLLAIAGACVFAQSLRVPIPAATYTQCKEAAKEDKHKGPEYKSYETVWDRTLADPVAYYTLWLMIFTGVLGVVGVSQGILIYDQIRLARDEFNATHRPILRVRKPLIIDLSPRFPRAGVSKGEVVKGSIEVSNVGEATAIVIGSRYQIYLGNRTYPEISDKPGFHDLLDAGRIIEVGKTIVISINGHVSLDPYVTSDAVIFLEGLNAERRCYVIGEIAYKPASSEAVRTTAFCRELSSNGMFWSVKDPDYDYED